MFISRIVKTLLKNLHFRVTEVNIARVISILLFSVIISGLSRCNKSEKVVDMSLSDSLSYYQGVYSGWILREAGYSRFNQELFDQGHSEILKSNFSFDSTLQIVSEKLNQYIKERERIFFEENAKQEGIKVTKSGLQYKVLVEGDGRKPIVGDSLILSYEGRRMDGLVFTQERYSTSHRELFSGNLPGLREGISLMKEGSQYIFFLPSKLGHGKITMGPPLMYDNMVSIFKIEIYKVIPKKN